MEVYSVKMTKAAYEDLRTIVNHFEYKLKNPQAALSVSEMLISSAEALSMFPKRHRVRKKDVHGRSIRFSVAGSYVLVYWVDDNAMAVEILRIIHSRRDINRLL